MPQPQPQLRDAARSLLALFRSLQRFEPGLDVRSLGPALEPLFRFAADHRLFDDTGPSLDALPPGVLEVVAEQIQLALEHPPPAPGPGGPRQRTAGAPDVAPRWHDVAFFHPCIHVAPELSFYAFPLRCGEDRLATRLACLDSNGQRYPASQLDPRLPFGAAQVERRVVRSLAPLRRIPAELLSAGGKARCLALLREGFPAGLPFRSIVHERRLRVWCLLTYLFPLLERTPFLRVRVPDIRSARNVELLLERACLSALTVHRSDHSYLIAGHRAALAGAVIFGPEVRTGRLPTKALNCLEDQPSAGRREPPVAFIEIYGDFARPRVPEEWVVDVELPAPVPPVRLEDPWPFCGCAVALSEQARLVREALEHREGVIDWLHAFLFDASPAAAATAATGNDDPGEGGFDDPEAAEVLVRTELGEQVDGVWARCRAERPASDASAGAAVVVASVADAGTCLACNISCLHGRLLEAFPGLRGSLGQPGHAATLGLRRRLMEQGIVTFGVSKIGGCLSPVQTAQWRRARVRGVEVPGYRLAGGVE